MMADGDVANQRREIRRRKILENSEARLNKISGSCNSKYADVNLVSHKEESQLSCSTNKDYGIDAQKNITDVAASSHNDYEIATKNAKNSCFKVQENTQSSKPYNSNNFSATSYKPVSFNSNGDKECFLVNGTVPRPNTSDAYAFPKKVSDAETRSLGRTRADSRRNSSCTQLMRETLQLSSLRCTVLRPWIAMALAVLVKAIFLFYDKTSFVESIFVPYLLLELSVYVWMKLETQGCLRQAPQSLVQGVLLLCGVPSSVIYVFSSMWNTVQCLSQDFAVYLFSFVLLHVLYENYVL